MWVITRAINEYDQDGEYFEMVFDHKPTPEELMYKGYSLPIALHLMNGGGRQSVEEVWYYLTEIGSGEQYITKQKY